MNLTTICSVGLAATVLVCGMDVFCAATAKKRLYASDIVWAVLFAGVQAFVFVWSAQGLVEADEGALMLMSVVVLDIACLAAAHLSLTRRAASGRLMLAAAPSDWTAYRVVSVFVALTALAAAAALCVLAVELPHNFALERVNARTVFVEWELLYAALVGLYFLGQRHAVLPSLVPVASMGIGVAEHFVFLFKGQPIQPGDMLAIGTAAAVPMATCTRCPLSACGGSPQAWRRCLCASCWRAFAAGPSTSATRASRLPTGTRASLRTRSPARPCSRASCRT